MVHLYVFNPVQKLRFLSQVWFRRSKHLLNTDASAGNPMTGSSIQGYAHKPAKGLPHISYRSPPTLPTTSNDQVNVFRDPDYYTSDAEGRFCTFLVENTLFRVHRCYLTREPSVFADMLGLPHNLDCQEGLSDKTAIPLSDTAEQFRDILWALYAPPSRFFLYSKQNQDDIPIERLLNVAEMSIKYCIASYEEWALERIHQLAQASALTFLRKAHPVLCARVLNVAVLSDHQSLLRIAEQRLIPRILWTKLDEDFMPIRKVAEHHNLRRLRGVAYYKELLLIVNSTSSQSELRGDLAMIPRVQHPDFSSIPNQKRRRAMRRAYRSLVLACQELPNNVPQIDDKWCPMHNECVEAWEKAWKEAASRAAPVRPQDSEEHRYGDGLRSADVLGRLKAMMIDLRRTLPEMNGMDSIPCTLAALEAISAMRDRIIDELLDHFTVG